MNLSSKFCVTASFAIRRALRPSRSGDHAILVMKPSEHRSTADMARWRRPHGWKPARPDRCLHPEPTMGTGVVVTNVFAQDAFRVAVVEHDDVVETVSSKSPDHPFAKRVRLRRPRRRDETPRAEALQPATQPGAVDRVAIVDEEARCLVVAVAHGLDEGLGGVLGTRGGRHPDAHNLAAPKVEYDEGVEERRGFRSAR